jgi:Predicted integral membrane protein (DUF2269)
MDWIGTLFLYLHIGGVIVAFGPTIALPFIAAKAAKEPMHGNFALRVSQFITEKVVEPGAVFVFLTGVGLILTRGYNPLVQLWVGAAIVLFVITFAFANLVQVPTIRKMIALTETPPAVVTDAPQQGEQPAKAGLGTQGAAGTGPAGPPQEFLALSAKAARGGQFMTVMLFVILALMVVKPF